MWSMLVRIRRFSVIASLLVSGILLTACSSPVTAATEAVTPAPATVAPSATKPVAVAIGDSIMKGFGLSPSEAWPALLAASNNWTLTNLACDGAGFGAIGDPGECDSDFAGLVSEAVALQPTLILISGSSNDLGIDDETLVVQTDAVVAALRAALPTATIVGISTVWNDTDTPTQIDAINAQVRQAMTQVNGVYLDIGQPLSGHRDWLQGDDVHPTVEGQQVLATAIDTAVREANLSLKG